MIFLEMKETEQTRFHERIAREDRQRGRLGGNKVVEMTPGEEWKTASG
jgi:hypothetical protein